MFKSSLLKRLNKYIKTNKYQKIEIYIRNRNVFDGSRYFSGSIDGITVSGKTLQDMLINLLDLSEEDLIEEKVRRSKIAKENLANFENKDKLILG